MRRWVSYGLAFALVVVLAWFSGAMSLARRLAGLPDREEIFRWWVHRGLEAESPLPRHPIVFLITGQSNAGNFGRSVHPPAAPDILNVWKGKIYKALDPMLGSDGVETSPWTFFARDLRARGCTRPIVLAIAVRGGTSVTRWADQKPMRSEVFARLRDLRSFGLEPNFVFWDQGESDSFPFHTDPALYIRTVQSLFDSLRASGVRAPILVAQATRNGYAGPSPSIRAAQLYLVDPAKGIFRGPDTDLLGPEFRYDGVHLSERGLERAAAMRADAIPGTAC